MGDKKRQSICKEMFTLPVMIVSVVLFVVTIGLIISMSEIDKQTEETTTFFTATVYGADVIDTGERVFAEIHIKEYDTSLFISANVCENIKMDEIRGLKDGQTVFFRIENVNVNQMNKAEFINIVSLKTNTKDIFSIDEYNKFISSSAYPTRIASIVTALLFLFISLFCFLKIKRNTKKKDTEQT